MTQALKLTYQTPAAEQILIQVEQGILTNSMEVSGANSGIQSYDMEEI